MSFNVIPVEKFKKEAKRLIKKYPSLKQELQNLAEILQVAPETGTSLGGDTYKIRIAIRSKGKGKSGGARVITYVVTPEKEVYLLTIYMTNQNWIAWTTKPSDRSSKACATRTDDAPNVFRACCPSRTSVHLRFSPYSGLR